MSCAITQNLMAHQWRKWSAPLLIGALGKKVTALECAIALSPMAHQWRNGGGVTLSVAALIDAATISSRAAADGLLHKMTADGEVERVARGLYRSKGLN